MPLAPAFGMAHGRHPVWAGRPAPSGKGLFALQPSGLQWRKEAERQGKVSMLHLLINVKGVKFFPFRATSDGFIP